MTYPVGAVERAMKVQEVIVRALSGQLTWLQAADILGRSPRSIRRLRLRFECYGHDGLVDRRRQTPSPHFTCQRQETGKLIRMRDDRDTAAARALRCRAGG